VAHGARGVTLSLGAMTLFEDPAEKVTTDQPLAARMRPRTLEEFVGQEHLLGPGAPLRKAILDGKAGSLILWGPAGCGKTTLAGLIATHSQAHFEPRSAVTTGVKEIREIGETARHRARTSGKRTVLFLDEVHHFTRTQQDSLLSFVETGTLELVGATTENPSFALATPLLSRCRVLILERLEPEHVRTIVVAALEDAERGLGRECEPDALEYVVRVSGGDARIALNTVEAAAELAGDDKPIALPQVEAALQRPAPKYDRAGDAHYDTISAFIKSIRGSDPDAGLHYLARMIEAGEDPRFIARRLVILASEDIGNADPMALVLAVAAFHTVERIGWPEAQLSLAQAVTYLACAPKSNASYRAIAKAMKDVQKEPPPPVPPHLRSPGAASNPKLGAGEGYLYPHGFPGHHVDQEYMPEGDWDLPYYEPSDQGREPRLREAQEKRRRR
jgi:putative ATPase